MRKINSQNLSNRDILSWEIDSDFVEGEIARLEQAVSDQSDTAPAVDTLNELFRNTLNEVWRKEQLWVSTETAALRFDF